MEAVLIIVLVTKPIKYIKSTMVLVEQVCSQASTSSQIDT
jgi:hypothetical protein